MISLKNKTLRETSLLMLPVFIILLCFNIYTVYREKELMHEASLATISLYQNDLENDLQDIELALFSFLSSSIEYSQLTRELDEYTKFSHLHTIAQRYQDLLTTYKLLSAMYLYAPKNNTKQFYYSVTYDYEDKRALLKLLEEELLKEESANTKGWYYLEVKESEKFYLVRVLGQDNLYTVCIVDLEEVVATLDENDVLIYANEERNPVSKKEWLTKHDMILPHLAPQAYTLLGKLQSQYLVTMQYSESAKTQLYYFKSYTGVLGGLDAFQVTMLLASVLVFSLVPIQVAHFAKQNFSPLDRLMCTMQQIRDGEVCAKAQEEYRVKEFAVLSSTFNGMMEEISNLKIERYENQLLEQQTKYLLLQSQIRPHFYLNSLKNIYALAQENDYEKIQEYVLNISAYLRHIIQEESAVVALIQELTCVEHYIAIQNATGRTQIICDFEISPETEQLEIPPISLLTFAENAVKHAQSPQKALHIHIKSMIFRDDETDYLNIVFSDNGPGFSDDGMERIVKGRCETNGNDSTGLNNVRQRFRIIYKEKASIVFYNTQEGASIDVFVPVGSI